MLVTDIQKANSFYEALVNRDEDYVGIFFAGVKTTSVFCISTCRARKPKRENVEFFTTFKDALDNGFRPCKICRPTENAHEAPDSIERAIEMVRDDLTRRVTDQMLREEGISPDAVRRWFKQNYGVTYHAFQRMYRINNAYREMKGGKRATDAAFDTGYDSLSGFGYTFKAIAGTAPSKHGERKVILMSRTTTPLGPMFICSTETGICLLEFVDRKMLETEFRDLQKRLHAVILAGENQHIINIKIQLREYFVGERTEFTVPIDAPGTEFQSEVWKTIRKIPYGQTTSYQNEAELLGNPNAIRAVARANGMNRIAIVIPCHRIIGKDGSLTGYGGGLERKRWLLEHEKRISSKMKHPEID